MKATLFLFALICNFAVFAVTPPNPDSETPAIVTVTTPVKPAPIIHVTKVCKYRSDVDSKSNASGMNVYPGDYVMVKIAATDLDSAKHHLKDYRLWIDGICFPNMEPQFINESEPGIIFQLERDTSKNSPWQLMYTNPSYWSFHRLINVNLGTQTTEYTISDEQHQLNLYTSTIWVPWVFYPLFIILLLVIIRYGKAFLKDTSLYTSNGVTIGNTPAQPTNAETGVININEVPYSLSRFQFLVWLLVVFFGILHIWIITDVLTSPTGSTLFLIGISSGTFYISKLLDKPSAANAQTGTVTVTAFLANKQQSQGILYDMLSDGKSISLHRLQLVLFTVFLASYFVLEVIGNLIMPQFDQTMLTLMGISNVTYAGIKTTES
jgi:hypothetical protein